MSEPTLPNPQAEASANKVPPVTSGTPSKYRSSSNKAISTRAPELDVKEVQTEMANNLDGEIVGGMPVDKFLDKFVPKSPGFENMPKTLPKFDKLASTKPQSGVPKAGSEAAMYPSLINLVETSQLLDGFYLLDTHKAPDKHSRPGRKWMPDVTMYEGEKPQPTVTGADFATVDLPWEFKRSGVASLFNDPKPDVVDPEALRAHPFQRPSSSGAEKLGQIATVLTEICVRQHRTHVFLVYLGDPLFRLIRADRCGLVASLAVDYRKNPDKLSEFLWRYSKLNSEQRGFDPTVRLASEHQAVLAKEKLEEYKPKEERPVVVMSVPTDNGPMREVLAWGALREAESLTGRATRAYPVWDLQDEKICFLKDTWRVAEMQQESDVLKEMNEKRVPHIPKIIAGGDLPGRFQTTITQDLVDEPWRCGYVSDRLSRRAHHRLLEDFVPHTLDFCRNANQMMHVIHHAFLAHEGAYKVGFLHRDISDNNILVVERTTKSGTELEGILIDWDLCLRVRDKNLEPVPSVKPRQRFRTGTWYFMSTDLLQNPTKLHLLRDDLESFLHLVLYLSLIWFDPVHLELSPADVLIRRVFQQVDLGSNGMYTGGEHKELMLKERRHLGYFAYFRNNPALTSWIDDALLEFGKFYTQRSAVKHAEARAIKAPLAAGQAEHSLLDELKEAQLNLEGLPINNHIFLKGLFVKTLERHDWSPNKSDVSLKKPKVHGTSKRTRTDSQVTDGGSKSTSANPDVPDKKKRRTDNLRSTSQGHSSEVLVSVSSPLSNDSSPAFDSD